MVQSSYSQAGSECVEVAWLSDGGVGVRDSKNPTGPALVFAPAEWHAFVTRVQELCPDPTTGNGLSLTRIRLGPWPFHASLTSIVSRERC
ncbi:DUF397 domain-containing protein [Nocardia sp. NPDC049707]|uniref:DUF397 domain-containing protein n=1 Tax=Nocardia sp. NPDC049707 TaxID=3154735 RepID=UPI00342B0C73